MENEKLIETVAEHTVEIKNIKEIVSDIKSQNDAIYRLATSVELLAQQGSTTNDNIKKLDESLNDKIDKVDGKVDKVDDKVNKMDKDLTEVKSKDDKKDAKKWNNSMKIIGAAILSAVIGIVLVKIGLI